jgi:hypothetical protein
VGPYIDYAQAVSHWSDQHVPETLLVMTEFFGYNHNFLVKLLEFATYDKASDETYFNHVDECLFETGFCTTFNTDQKQYDKLFEQARNANIRLFQVALANSAFSLLHPYDQPAFEYFMHPDVERGWSCEAYLQDFRSGTVAAGSSISSGSEFTTRVSLEEPMTHTWISPGLLLSMKVPIDFGDTFIEAPVCDHAVPTIAQKILLLANTKAKKFGSRIDPYFADDATYLLLQMAEAGVGNYNAYMSATGDNDARSPDMNLFKGLMDDVVVNSTDYDLARLFQSDPANNPRVLFAIFGEINDVLNIDTFGSWFVDNTGNVVNWWPEIMADQGLDVYVCDDDSVCGTSLTRFAAWEILTGSRSDYTIRDDLYRSRGVVNAYPCTFPGLVGATITAGLVHYGFSAPLIFDFESDLSLPAYLSFNDLPIEFRFDELYRTGPNGFGACIPWRTSLFDDRFDSPCCEAALGGACGCATNPYASGICGEPGLCENYDTWGWGPMNTLFEWYSGMNYSEPAYNHGFTGM